MAISLDPAMMKLVNELHKMIHEQTQAIAHANHQDLYSLGKLQGGLFSLESVLEMINLLGSEEDNS